MSSRNIKIGIIGGTGLDNPDILKDKTEKEIDTPYGKPSDHLVFGKISGVDCVILARHDKMHRIMPTNINYRANIWALKEVGCTHIISTNACGSLQEDCHPGDFVFPDQFIDRTTKRFSTLYDGEDGHPVGICHIGMHEPFSESLRQIFIETAKSLEISHLPKGTAMVIEGPRFSSKAESKLFKSWGCDIINMTIVPEVCIAQEAGLLYASVCLITDYDCWKDDASMVNLEYVKQSYTRMIEKAKSFIIAAVTRISEKKWDTEITTLNKLVSDSIMK